MSEFDRKSLGQLADCRMGETILSKDLDSTGYPIFSASSSAGAWGRKRYISKVLRRGSIVVGARGTIGNPRLPDHDEFGCTQTTIAVIPSGEVDPYYLKLALESSDLMSIAAQQAVPMLTIGDLSRLELPIPPLPEQKKIAEILSGIDKLLSEHNNYCDKLTNLLRAEIFIEFCKYDNNERRRVSLLQLAKEVKRGPSLSTNNERKGVRYVTSGSICDGKVRLDLDEKFLDGYDGIDSCVIRENDLLLNCVNSAARVGASAVFIGKDYCITGFNNFAITLRPDLCDPRYIYYWTTSSDFRSQVRTIIKDAINQVSFSKKDLGEFFLSIPDLEHQQRVAEKMDSLKEIHEKKDREIAVLKNLKSAISSELLTGRKRVSV